MAAQTTPTASSVAVTYGYDADNRRISQAANDNSWIGYPAATAKTTAYFGCLGIPDHRRSG